MNMTDQEKTEFVARTIDQLCEEHGLAAMYFVCAPTHATHALRFDTAPWCRVKMIEESDGKFVGFRVKSHHAEYVARGLSEDDARAQQQRDMEYTISMLDHFGGQGGPAAAVALSLLHELNTRFGAHTTSRRVGDAGG
jgi:hypothetical protein